MYVDMDAVETVLWSNMCGHSIEEHTFARIMLLNVTHTNTYAYQQYCMDEIKEILCSHLDEHNLPAAAQFASDNSEEDLLDVCICLAPKFLSRISSQSLAGISAYVAQMLMTSVREGGLSSFLFAQRWCEVNVQNAKELPRDARALLDAVCLEGVSTQDLARVCSLTVCVCACMFGPAHTSLDCEAQQYICIYVYVCVYM
jgi:hypothetical protein